MFGFGGGGIGGGFAAKGLGFGGYGYGQSFTQLEEMAKETERQLEDELNALADWQQQLAGLAGAWRERAASITPPSVTGAFELGQGGRWVLPRVSDHSCGSRTLCAVGEGTIPGSGGDPALCVSSQELAAFASAPLSVLGLPRFVVQAGKAGEQVDEHLGFDVHAHPDAQSKVAQDMHRRLVRDMADYAAATNLSLCTLCKFLPAPAALLQLSAEEQAPALAAAAAELEELVRLLDLQRSADMRFVLSSLPLVVRAVNAVPLEACTPEDERRRRLFALRQISGAECKINLELLFCSVISCNGAADLRRLNPFIADPDHLLNLVVAAILHASRVGQVNRCLIEAKELQAELQALQARLRLAAAPPCAASSSALEEARLKETVSRVTHKAETLAGLLSTKRHYMRETEGTEGTHEYDPRFLLFEFTW